MRLVGALLLSGAFAACSLGCAETSACAPGQVLVDGECAAAGPTKTISVGCRNSANDTIGILGWELTVNPVAIESGEPFTATLDGVAVFSEEFLDDAQTVFAGGVKEVNLVDLNATVHVRSGATGADVTLVNEEIPYKCALPPRTECDSANDLPGVPGQRGNTDCQPQDNLNPCGQFVLIPTSSDCSESGICAALKKTGPKSQCSDNGFCVIGDVSIPLERDFGEYMAGSDGRVLFGWADESTGATIDTRPIVSDPTGPLGLRVGIGPLLVALECVMPAATEDHELVSFPIEMP